MGAHHVFVTGGTGYMGQRLLPELVGRGHRVRALARKGSEHRLPKGVEAVIGNALDARTYAASVFPCDTFIHLIGTPHPSPAKAEQFRTVDLVSIHEAVNASVLGGIKHFVYLSVAQPSRLMRAYVEVREQGERMIREAELDATMLRPWYVLGPGHRWPYTLIPLYAVLERFPGTREGAMRQGLVTLKQMIRALVDAVENPPRGVRLVPVNEIRGSAKLFV